MTSTVPVAAPPVRKMKPRKRGRIGFWRRFLFVVVLLLVIGVAAFLGWTGMSPSSAFQMLGLGAGFVKDKIIATPPFGGRKHINILMLGADVSFDGSGAARTDTIKLVSLDLENKNISVLSIPRDTWIEIPDHGEGRINSAYQFGGRDESDRLAMAEKTITGVLGELSGEPVTIDKYIRIQTGGFIKIIDALGGVDVDVEKQMDYEDPSQDLFIHLKPGLQRLDGYQSMCYVRFRHDAEGDYGRIRRQDQLMRALADKLRSADKRSMLRLLGPITGMMKTDLSVNDLLAIKRIADDVGMAGIHSATLPTVPTRKGRAQVVEVQDPEAARLAISEVLHGPRPTVLVLNGSGESGMAGNVSEQIDTRTYNVVGVGNTVDPVESSAIIADKRNKASAQSLATRLGMTPAEVVSDQPVPEAKYGKHVPTPPPAEITIILGKNYTGVPQQTAQDRITY